MVASVVVLGVIVSVAIFRVRKEQQERIYEREHKISAEARMMYEMTFEGLTLDDRGQPMPKPPEAKKSVVKR